MNPSLDEQAMTLVCRSLLNLSDLLRVARVCKAWNAIVMKELPRIKGGVACVCMTLLCLRVRADDRA